MAGDNASGLIGHRKGKVCRCDQALHRTTSVKIDIGVKSVEKHVAHVDHITDREMNDAVTVGMTIGNVIGSRGFAIEM